MVFNLKIYQEVNRWTITLIEKSFKKSETSLLFPQS